MNIKRISLFIVLLIVLSACGNSENKNTENENAQQQAQTEEKQSSEQDKQAKDNGSSKDSQEEKKKEVDLNYLPIDEYIEKMEYNYLESIHHLFGEYNLLLEEYENDEITYDQLRNELASNVESLSLLINDFGKVRPADQPEIEQHHLLFISLLEEVQEVRLLGLESLGDQEEDYDRDQDILYTYVQPKIRDLEKGFEDWGDKYYSLIGQEH